jgi:hypothetical protein
MRPFGNEAGRANASPPQHGGFFHDQEARRGSAKAERQGCFARRAKPDDPIYQRSWNFIMGQNLNPHLANKKKD